MKFEIENSVIASYKRFSYEPWYALAEFVDNSTQAYFDNKAELDDQFVAGNEKLTVKINYEPKAGTIVITDNSIGMDEVTLARALKVGTPPPDPSGRSRYGLGMKTAACWFGNIWTIRTKRLGTTKGLQVNIDVDKIARTEGDVDLNVQEFTDYTEGHYTTITIGKLNMKLAPRKLGKIREYLSSMYRFDYGYGLHLYWNDDLLSWPSIEDKLHLGSDKQRYKQPLDFEINGKRVTGWAGVLGRGHGTRKLGGFAIIQNNRLIEEGYKPTSLYGEQEGGSNDLVNQRLVGELFLEQFSVSHTKDRIVWEEDEQEELDKELGKRCAEAREMALTLRFHRGNQRDEMARFKEAAVTTLTSELQSNELANYLQAVQPNPEKVIDTSFVKLAQRVESAGDPSIEVNIGSIGDAINVKVFFNDSSAFDPYVLTETTVDSNKVLVIINQLHPHVQDMTEGEAFTNFVRQSIYDGVAEWKALRLRGALQPNTIKLLKDGLLRIPYEIKSHQGV